MATVQRFHWDPEPGSGLPRRDRRGCDYDAYIPDRLVGRTFLFDGPVAADIAEAEAAIARFNAEAAALGNSEGLARLLLRAEAVASSRIEGLEVGGRRLLRAEVAQSLGDDARDVTAEEILANIDAMSWAVDNAGSARSLGVAHLLEVHRRLLSGTRYRDRAGRIRTEQNWIGGSSFNPCSADFVPPPPSEVVGLLEDLCQFCNEDSLPAVAQAAIAHAQFETIHPFDDGNGRTGRALIQVVLHRRGLAPRALPPVSLVLATWAKEYVGGLMATRYLGDADSALARAGTSQWHGLFAAASIRAVADALLYERRVQELQDQWRARLGRVRRGSTADLLLALLPAMPIVTVSAAAARTGRSFQAANGAVGRLADVGILRPLTVGRRSRAFEARDLFDAFTDLERRLASARGDTAVAPPGRAVPPR